MEDLIVPAALALAAPIIDEFVRTVTRAVSDAYVALHRLGYEDAQIVALLGLLAETRSPAGTEEQAAA